MEAKEGQKHIGDELVIEKQGLCLLQPSTSSTISASPTSHKVQFASSINEDFDCADNQQKVSLATHRKRNQVKADKYNFSKYKKGLKSTMLKDWDANESETLLRSRCPEKHPTKGKRRLRTLSEPNYYTSGSTTSVGSSHTSTSSR